MDGPVSPLLHPVLNGMGIPFPDVSGSMANSTRNPRIPGAFFCAVAGVPAPPSPALPGMRAAPALRSQNPEQRIFPRRPAGAADDPFAGTALPAQNQLLSPRVDAQIKRMRGVSIGSDQQHIFYQAASYQSNRIIPISTARSRFAAPPCA